MAAPTVRTGMICSITIPPQVSLHRQHSTTRSVAGWRGRKGHLRKQCAHRSHAQSIRVARGNTLGTQPGATRGDETYEIDSVPGSQESLNNDTCLLAWLRRAAPSQKDSRDCAARGGEEGGAGLSANSE